MLNIHTLLARGKGKGSNLAHGPFTEAQWHLLARGPDPQRLEKKQFQHGGLVEVNRE